MKVKIIGIEELRDKIAGYSAMFPKKYTNLNDIKKSLSYDYKFRGGTPEIFGVSVSPYMENRCYAFQYVGNGKEVVYKFIGMWKS